MSPTSGVDLLRALGSGVVPGRDVTGGGGSVGAGGGVDFNAMLEGARRGELSTGRPVAVEPGLDLDLSDEQMERLSRAVDRAESSGAGRALVLLDGQALTVDVNDRRVIAQQGLGDERVLTDIDAVVPAPSEDDLEEPESLIGPPSGWAARDVMRALGIEQPPAA
ncbi:MAG: hypothetical protein AAF356_04275 [Planctomycetota bacterium]